MQSGKNHLGEGNVTPIYRDSSIALPSPEVSGYQFSLLTKMRPDTSTYIDKNRKAGSSVCNVTANDPVSRGSRNVKNFFPGE